MDVGGVGALRYGLWTMDYRIMVIGHQMIRLSDSDWDMKVGKSISMSIRYS